MTTLANSAKFTVSGALLAGLLAGACGAPPPRPTAEDVSHTVDAPMTAIAAVGRRFQVDTEASQLRILAFPDGPLARLGHSHVIGGGVAGEIWLADDFHASSLELFIDVAALRVDPPDWRRDEGFPPEMDEATVAGTRRNMLSPAMLDAEQHPEIAIRSVAVSGPDWQPDVTVEITLRGKVRAMTVPVALTVADHAITATGRLRLLQTEFGIDPFSAAGGNLLVADELVVRFRIIARAPDPES